MPPRAASPPPLPLSSPTATSTKEHQLTLAPSTDQLRPCTLQQSTDTSVPTVSNSPPVITTLPLRPRNRSPFSRTHLRSQSSSSSLSAPLMTRAHSSPVVNTAGRFIMSTPPTQSSTPFSAPTSTPRRRSPMRRATDDAYPSFGFAGSLDIGETISEKDELELTPRGSKPTDSADADNNNNNNKNNNTTTPNSPLLTPHSTFPRSRRRPASPLHQLASPLGIPSPARHPQLRPSVSSPSLATLNTTNSSSIKYTETYPSSSTSFSSSSMPSTPTSLRSRSPSISSLETIPDSPDAEEAALEAEQVALLKAAADRESDHGGGDDGGKELGGGRRRIGGGLVGVASAGGVGYAGGRADKRKRWSVCGAERRGDLDLETIWED